MSALLMLALALGLSATLSALVLGAHAARGLLTPRALGREANPGYGQMRPCIWAKYEPETRP